MNRIGILGGTFDPPHNGHLHLALSLAEIHGLHEVWFCPAWINPHKQKQKSASASDRLAMVKLALQPIASFRLLEYECRKKRVSYTVDTLRELVEEQKDKSKQFHLLLGEDCAETLHTWKEPEEIVRLAPPLIGARFYGEKNLPDSSSLASAIEQGWTPIPVLEISATALRERWSKGLYCGHLLPSKVVDYIYRHQLY